MTYIYRSVQAESFLVVSLLHYFCLRLEVEFAQNKKNIYIYTYTVCITMVQSEKNYSRYDLCSTCVFGTISKQNKNYCSFCCLLNHIICFCKSRVVRQGKIPFVPLFIFIEEIVMEVSTTKKFICEDNDERNYYNIFKYDIYVCVCGGGGGVVVVGVWY